jgi:endopolyphosphatase
MIVDQVVHITDPHVDPYYQRGATESSQCHSLPDTFSIFRKKTSPLDSSSHAYGWPGSTCDSPILLINGTFHTLSKKFANDLDFVFFTGDSSR